MPFPLSLTGRRWDVRRTEPIESVEDFIRSLAAERGLIDSDATGRLTLSDPFLFAEMSAAVERIRSAVAAKETIAIFGDYDADGITASAQLVRCFRRQGIEPIVYLPHRMREGYGMKTASIDALHLKGATLIITVDTGIAAHHEIEHASGLHMDVIVTDHHHPSLRSGQALRPSAFAVIHPTVPTDFPNPHLSGAGVAFMLVRALEKEKAWPGIQEDMALAAIGTIADLVPLTGENRILVTHGLKFLQSLPTGPLREFVDQVRNNGAALSATDIAFRLVPRINASGRMDDPTIALDALLHGGASLARLHQLNAHRQVKTAELFDIAKDRIDPSHIFLTAQSSDFTAGLVGLIAGRLTQEYGRPSMVAAENGELSTGSFRSIPQVDIMSVLTHPSIAPLLVTFGGHSQAAGCTFRSVDFLPLSLALNAVMAERGFTVDDLVPTLMIDASIAPQHITLPLLESTKTLEPFGQSNAEPLFLLQNQRIDSLRCVGTDGKHLQCRIGDRKAIGFSLGHIESMIEKNALYDIACRFGSDSWNGRNDVQVIIEDVRKAA